MVTTTSRVGLTCPRCGAPITEWPPYARCPKCEAPFPAGWNANMLDVAAPHAVAHDGSSAKPMGKPQEVVVTGLDIPFWDLVTLLITLGIAAIPAVLVLGIVGALVMGLVAALMR